LICRASNAAAWQSSALSGSSIKRRRGSNTRRAERDTLLLPTRELGRLPFLEAVKLYETERAGDALTADSGRLTPRTAQRNAMFSNTFHVGKQRVALKDDADIALEGRQPGDYRSAEPYFALVMAPPPEIRQELKQGRLSGTASASNVKNSPEWIVNETPFDSGQGSRTAVHVDKFDM